MNKVVFLLFLILLTSRNLFSQIGTKDTSLTFKHLFEMGISTIQYENNIVEFDDSIIVDNFNFKSFTYSTVSNIKKNNDQFILYYLKKKLVKIAWKIPNSEFYTNIFIKENERFYIYCLQIVFNKTKEIEFYPHFIMNDKTDSTNLMVGFIPTGDWGDSTCIISKKDRINFGIDESHFVIIGLDQNLDPQIKLSFIEGYISGFSRINKIDKGTVVEFYGVPIPSLMKRNKISDKINTISYKKIKYLLDGIMFAENYTYVKYRVKKYLNCFYYLDIRNID